MDIFLTIAGLGGILIAMVHGYIGHTKILTSISDLPPSLWRVNYAVFQMSTVYWALGGFLLCCAPFFFGEQLRAFIALTMAFVYASGAVANFWATRGRHFGWALLAIVAICAVLGAGIR